MITADSRYSQSETSVVVTPDGRSVVEIQPSARSAWSFTFAYYRIKSGDRLDRIAAAEYSDPRLWWVIADANPEIQDWWNLPPNTVLRIPSV